MCVKEFFLCGDQADDVCGDNVVDFLRRRRVLCCFVEREEGDYDILCDDGVYEFVGKIFLCVCVCVCARD